MKIKNPEKDTFRGKKLSSYILDSLRSRLKFPNSKIARSEFLLNIYGSQEMVCAMQVTASVKHGEQFIDCALAIYWDRLDSVNKRLMSDAPFQTIPSRRWELPCIILSLDKFSNLWPAEGVFVSNAMDVDTVTSKICEIYRESGEKFFQENASLTGMLKYLAGHPNAPGTWRITLDFLLHERLFGYKEACAHLNRFYPFPDTGWGRHQKKWLLENEQVLSDLNKNMGSGLAGC